MHYLGVTGIEVVGRDGEALPVTLDILSANPPDLHTLPGHEQDDRTLDKWVHCIIFITGSEVDGKDGAAYVNSNIR